MTGLPHVEARSLPVDDLSTAVVLCPFRLCDWRSEDTSSSTPAELDAKIRWHLIDTHRGEIDLLAEIHGAPAGVCARPHPTDRIRFCLEPRGGSHPSHGDGRIDRWLSL